MPIDVSKLKEQTARLLRREGRTRQPQRPSVPTAGSSWVPVVLRSLDVEMGTMTAQRIRYADSPPVIGQYEAWGSVFEVYPLVTAVYEDYELWVWPDDEDHPLSTLAVPMIAIHSGREWQVMIPAKVDGSLLPADESVSGCNFG